MVQRRFAALGGKGRSGCEALRDVLDARAVGRAPESALETRVAALFRRAGLAPVRQHVVRCGARSYRLDFAWPAARVAVEADGFAVHGGRVAFERDRHRLADLAAAGWRVVPVTWAHVRADADGVVAGVRDALRQLA